MKDHEAKTARSAIPRIAAAFAVVALLAGCGTGRPGPPAPQRPSGPYLGQATPGAEPVLFAPGIVSTSLFERDLTVTPDGREMFFSVILGNYDRAAILTVRESADGTWGEPEVAPFSGRYKDLEPALSPDGERLYFVSYRPREGDGPAREDTDLWAIDRTPGGWGEPFPLPAPVNTGESEFFPSVTRDGTLYFTRDGEGGASTLFRARPTGDGGYAEPERLPEQVNAGAAQFNGWVDPGERFLVFGAVGREDSRGGSDYYVSFRNEDDTWVGPVNLGDRINTASGLEYSASLSPDGRFLFFMAARSAFADPAFETPRTAAGLRALANGPRNGPPDIWWTDATFLDDLRP